MREHRVILYDRSAPEAVAVRAALRPPLLALVRARDRRDRVDVERFNRELAAVADRVQDDPEWAVRVLTELFFALDRAVVRLAGPTMPRGLQVQHLLGEPAS